MFSRKMLKIKNCHLIEFQILIVFYSNQGFYDNNQFVCRLTTEQNFAILTILFILNWILDGCYQLNVWIDFDTDEQRRRSFYNQIIIVPVFFLPKILCNELNQLNQHEIYWNFLLVFRSRIIFEVIQVRALNSKRKTLKQSD